MNTINVFLSDLMYVSQTTILSYIEYVSSLLAYIVCRVFFIQWQLWTVNNKITSPRRFEHVSVNSHFAKRIDYSLEVFILSVTFGQSYIIGRIVHMALLTTRILNGQRSFKQFSITNISGFQTTLWDSCFNQSTMFYRVSGGYFTIYFVFKCTFEFLLCYIGTTTLINAHHEVVFMKIYFMSFFFYVFFYLRTLNKNRRIEKTNFYLIGVSVKLCATLNCKTEIKFLSL